MTASAPAIFDDPGGPIPAEPTPPLSSLWEAVGYQLHPERDPRRYPDPWSFSLVWRHRETGECLHGPCGRQLDSRAQATEAARRTLALRPMVPQNYRFESIGRGITRCEACETRPPETLRDRTVLCIPCATLADARATLGVSDGHYAECRRDPCDCDGLSRREDAYIEECREAKHEVAS